MKYKTFATEFFKKRLKGLSHQEQRWIRAIRDKLKTTITGEKLHYNWFLEKKLGGKRLYFIVDYQQKRILMIDYGDKKEQQEIINFVISNKRELFSALRKL